MVYSNVKACGITSHGDTNLSVGLHRDILPEFLASEFIAEIKVSKITVSLWENMFTAVKGSISNLEDLEFLP